MEMCIIFAALTWPENPADAISEVLTPTFHTLRSTMPEQLLSSGYATASQFTKAVSSYSMVACPNTREVGVIADVSITEQVLREISKFPEILGKLSMRKQCVPGSFRPTHAWEPGNEAILRAE